MAKVKQKEIIHPNINASWIFVKDLNAKYNGNQLSIWECSNCHKTSTYKFQRCLCGAKMENSHAHDVLETQWEHKKRKTKK